MKSTELLKADAIALAAAKASFTRWCEEQAKNLCDEFRDLYYEKIDEIDAALRNRKFLDVAGMQYFEQRKSEIEKKMFKIAYEIGVLVFPYFLPMRLRRWRESQKVINI